MEAFFQEIIAMQTRSFHRYDKPSLNLFPLGKTIRILVDWKIFGENKFLRDYFAS